MDLIYENFLEIYIFFLVLFLIFIIVLFLLFVIFIVFGLKVFCKILRFSREVVLIIFIRYLEELLEDEYVV